MLMRYVDTGVWDAVITHNRYTLLSHIADPLLTQASQRGMAVVNAAPYGSGILAKGPDAGQNYAYRSAPAEVLERVRDMQSVCAEYSVAARPPHHLDHCRRDAARTHPGDAVPGGRDHPR
jgi:D-threo-aldose 1-dehydrogenase